MHIVLTEWHKVNPNHWCYIDKDTHDLLAHDKNLKALSEKVKHYKDGVFCKNWTRATPFRDLPAKDIEQHRQFLAKHRSKAELKVFNKKLETWPSL